MTESDRKFAGSIPALYDEYIGPLLMEPNAVALAARLSGVTAGRVLEIAAGTGILTRALLNVMPQSVDLVATDLNQAMIDHAQKRTQAPNLSWRAADAQTLPFADESFQAIACQFGAMFFPDKPTAYREALRVLRPGEEFVFNVWDRIANNELTQTVNAAVAGLFPDDPPNFLIRTPHGYHDAAIIRGDLIQAGFRDIAIEPIECRSRCASARDAAIALCRGTPLRNEIEARDPARLEEAVEAAERAVRERYGAGPIDAPMRAFIVIARR